MHRETGNIIFLNEEHKMRVVGFIPSKLNSERLPRKNILPLRGVPLVNYVLRTLNNVTAIDECIVFASEPSIITYIEKGIRYSFLERPASLDTQDAKLQDFLGAFIDRVMADIIVLHHITSPFLSPETVSECIENVVSGRYDSAFTALEAKRYAWFNGKPLNYSLDMPTPRTQDLQPVMFEQSGLYVFRREIFETAGKRIAPDPYIKIVDEFEGHDIDTPEDFRLAELILDAKLVQGIN
jgi:CMP-N-acetylneuraminic acid synthetase